MPPIQITAPGPEEFAPFYGRYVDTVRDAPDILAVLRGQPEALAAACSALGDREASARPAAGKWCVKEVIGHVTETERIFAYRLLRIARGDETPLPGFDQDAYVAEAGFDRVPLETLAAEFQAVRQASLLLVEGLPAGALHRAGTANGAALSARAVVYILAGHARHHMRILRDQYGLDVELDR